MKGIFREWDETPLKGVWQCTLKVDGVQAVFTDKGVVSRKDKPLYNLDKYFEQGIRGNYEIFHETHKKTIQATRTKNTPIEIPESALYCLEDGLDGRLKLGWLVNPSVEEIKNLLREVRAAGNEGLVLRQGYDYIKVKPYKTYDVKVLGKVEGKGRNKGRLGAFITEKGKVGGGFTDKQREEYWHLPMTGKTIEVKCMELTPGGMFRHPQFERPRPDKD